MNDNSHSFRRAVCVGASTIDRFGETAEPGAILHTSNIGRMRTSFGGAARNVAENLARLGVPTTLLSVVGADAEGEGALAATAAGGVDIGACLRVPGARTASYTAIFDGKGELVIGLADMEILNSFDGAALAGALASWNAETLVFADANLPAELLLAIADAKAGPLAIGPVSVQKSRRIRTILDRIDHLFLNRYEAEALVGPAPSLDALADRLRSQGVSSGVVTAGAKGALAWDADARQQLLAPRGVAANVNGAGDAFAAATLARLHAADSFVAAAQTAVAAAALTVETEATVRDDLTMELVMNRARLLNQGKADR